MGGLFALFYIDIQLDWPSSLNIALPSEKPNPICPHFSIESGAVAQFPLYFGEIKRIAMGKVIATQSRPPAASTPHLLTLSVIGG